MGFIEKIRDYALTRGYYKKYPSEDGGDGQDQGDYDEDIDDTEEPPAERTALMGEPRRYRMMGPSKVYNFPASSQQSIVIISPESIDQSGDVSYYIKENQTVVVSLDTVKHETAQRIVDFLSGVVHALDGNIEYVTNKIFVLAPKNVEINANIKEEIRKGGILASLKSSFM